MQVPEHHPESVDNAVGPWNLFYDKSHELTQMQAEHNSWWYLSVVLALQPDSLGLDLCSVSWGKLLNVSEPQFPPL